VTFRDLQKLMEQDQENQGHIGLSVEMTRLLNDCPKMFYKWNDKNHWSQHDKQNKKQCCFWDWIGVPLKDNVGMPVLPYQRLLYRMLKEHMHIWIKKSRGLGITTFFLYWIAHNCLTLYKPGDRVCIVVGPGIDIAEDWIARFKSLFRENFPAVYSELIKQQRTVAILNGVRVEAFPSHHVDTMRGLDKVKCIMSDETDMYPPFQQKEVRAVIEGYIGKPNSDPHILLVSTPKNPNGLMQQIELEQNSLYYKMFLTYEYGLEGPRPIYSKEQIEKAKKSPDFPREYEGQYIGLAGNVLSSVAIDRCIKLGEEMDKTAPIDNWNIDTSYVMSIDIGWGSSATAIMVSRWVNNKVQIVYSKEFADRPLFQDIIDEIWRLKTKCNNNLKNIIVDASATELYTALCTDFNQPSSLKYLQDKQLWCKKVNTYLGNHLFIVPVAFGSQTHGGRDMLNHTQRIIQETEDDGSALVAIHKQFNDLISSCRSAYAVEDKLDKKERTVHADTFDTLRLNLSWYKWN
jgi:hypothetical protein